jgi:hypothetical protein
MTIGAIQFDKLDFSDAEKEVTVNENFYRVWWLGRRSILDRNLTTPPGSPAAEDAYLVATGGTGAWAGHDGDIAYYFGTCWHFFTPWEGLLIWVDDENIFSTYTGAAWVDMAYGVDNSTIEISSGGLLKLKDLGITNVKISTSAAIDASKIADGSINNTKFQYLVNVTSDIQGQINAKAPIASPTFTENVGIGVSTFGTNANMVLAILNGTAPMTSPIDCFQMYSYDQAAGNACPHFRTENGSIIILFQGAALTAAFTTLTHTAPGTPDFNIQDLTNSGGYGFVSKDEGNTVLSVIANLQTRVNELEARLKAHGLLV